MAEVNMHSTDLDFKIRPKNSNESLEQYIEYLKSTLLIVKDETIRNYISDIINSYKAYVKFLNGTYNDKDATYDGQDDIAEKLSFQQQLEDKLSKIMGGTSKANPFEDVLSLEDIKKAGNNAPHNTMGTENKFADILVGDFLKVSPETVIYDNYELQGDGKPLTSDDEELVFIVDSVLYFSKKDDDSVSSWQKIDIENDSSNNIVYDLNTHCTYNPEHYCKICHLSSYNTNNPISGFVHSCNYELVDNINALDDEYTKVAA